MLKECYQIKSSHFCCGIIVNRHDHVILETAPIVSYMKGWDLARVYSYCKSKNWILTLTNFKDFENIETDIRTL